ncbi:MAG TPA: HD-GYP domain-containing protein [Selenomonadales bacterium]|nr:HD-GYP domain-containing protein [Selenomonadales bacterium]
MAAKLRLYLLEEAKPGMVLGADVVSARGKIMLSANTILTDGMIQRLSCWGFTGIVIIEDDAESPALRNKKRADRVVFNAQYDQTVTIVKKAFEHIRMFKEIPFEQIREVTDDTVMALIGTPGALGYLHSLRSIDNYTFQHSVNVAIIVGVLCKWLDRGEEETKELIFAGLLHDIGKALVPPEILNKPGKLTPPEMGIMKRHATLGYEAARKAAILNRDVLKGIWQHHERLDGSGYPQGIGGEEVAFSAKIVAIADIYDAMTSDRVYRNRLTPFAAIKTLFESMFDKLDAAICTVFLSNLKDYFVGTAVNLTDGRLGEIIYMDGLAWDRITVKTADGECIELHENHDIQIDVFFYA